MPAYSRSNFLFTRGPARHRRPAAQRYPTAQRQRPAAQRYPVALALLGIFALLALAGCNAEPRKTDAELGLTPTQAIGRHVFDANCARCHEPYSSHGLHGPSLHNLYKKQYLPSGQPANDDRISEVIMRGRAKMPSFSGTLSQSQLDDLLDYLKTL